jgi:phosphate transport system permease protein
MLSAPSIVIGLFVYALMVATLGGFSGWAGSVALSLIAIPVVVRTTENMLLLVPSALREAAFAVGAPRWQVSLKITLRAVKAGVVTGILLAIARVTGETAPLLFTALNNQFYSTDMSRPMGNLPVVIFQFAMSPYENWVSLAWGGALLIALTGPGHQYRRAGPVPLERQTLIPGVTHVRPYRPNRRRGRTANPQAGFLLRHLQGPDQRQP